MKGRHTEIDKELAIATLLPDRQSHDTTEIVSRTPLLLGKVADELGSIGILLGENVEQEGVNIVIQRFVVQEHF